MSVFNDYRKWNRRRAAIGRLEQMGGSVRSSEWERSDDAATDIMHDAMRLLENVTATLTEIREALCMGSWTCSEAESMHELLLGLGQDETAEHFMLCHAYSDDDEADLHRYIEGDETTADRWERVDDETE
jgi:hypothetical protein